MTSAAKVIQFPLAGIARDQDYRKAYIPSEGTAFATPFAVNVLGSCTFGDRRRGGSRPGLKAFTGAVTTTTGDWKWPNGDTLTWSGTGAGHVVYDVDAAVVAPDGSLLFEPHATFKVSAAKGSVPNTVTAMAKYRARLVVAGGTMWYASRQGDVTDFDYGGDGEDTGRACAGNAALADCAGEAVTALAAIEDKYLAVATARSLRILAGEPTTGEWAVASEHTGIISRDAWCWDGATLWFVGQGGVYALVPGENAVRKASSRLPEDFKGLAAATMVYDAERGGIHILAERGTGESVTRAYWFYDTEAGAFWEMDYPSAKRPTLGALCVINGVNRVVFKCADGVWRYPYDGQATDDGTAVESKVAVGPLRASARDDMDGMLAELTATLGAGSADVTVEVYAAHSPEAAVADAESASASPLATLSASAGWNRVWRPRVRGAWVIFVLKATGRWAYESMTAVCKTLGRLR